LDTNYSKIDQQSKQHLLDLINWLVDEVASSGGDGDALWYSRYYNVEDLKLLVEEYNNKQKFPDHWKIRLEGENLWYGEGQEGLLITNNKEYFDKSPDWTQVKIRY